MAIGILRSWGGRAVIGVVNLVVLAACSAGSTVGSTSGAPNPSAAGSPSTPQSPDEAVKQDALAAYLGMWKDFVDAGTTSDWQSPKLGQHATGIALTNLTRGLYADHSNGLVTKGQPALNPMVSTVEPAGDPKKIIVSDCGDSTAWLKYRADGNQVADDKPGGRQKINAVVEKQADGSWKVSDFGVHGVGTC
ncbi:hypothetical protein [Saccharothrix sp. NRRL B-16314]|uniref:hypothetical protein n=1 Tax=Saccharothrix sp. NRRL B-16314 TaxID=1463825 RepID=UPI001E3E7693|nr:hypothetical protein [Saccharothrix sp. NRRL B-16314]